jgi:hypothetical protein
MLTFDENGHHKPTHKHAKPSQKCGPYQIKRVNSMHDASSASNRSADNLPCLLHVDSHDSSASSSSTSQGTRRVKSETASPQLKGASFAQVNSQLPPLDLSRISYQPYVSSYDLFSNVSENDQGLYSAGLSATSVDWSNYDLEFSTGRSGDNFAPSSFSQPQSYGAFDYSGSEQAPTLTTTTSGEVSEVDDFMGPNFDDFDTGAFGRTSAASSTFNLATTQMPHLVQSDLGSVEFNEHPFLKGANKFLPTPVSLSGDEQSMPPAVTSDSSGFTYVDDDSALWMEGFGSSSGSGLPAMTNSPDPNMASYWNSQ